MNRWAVLVAALVVLALTVTPLEAQSHPPEYEAPVHQTTAGPCNMINVTVNADDMQDGIFDGFVVHPTASVGTVTAEEINTYVNVTVKTGSLECTTTDSTSQVGGERTPPRDQRPPRSPHRLRSAWVVEATESRPGSITLRVRPGGQR